MTTKKKKEFTFKFVIPDGLRDLYVNGAWGGVTPRNEIHMHLYSERSPIPTFIRHDIDENNKILEKGREEFGGNIVRLVQASIVMDINTSIAIRDWLTNRIELAQKIEEQQKEQGQDHAK